MEIRTIQASDAEALFNLNAQPDRETSFMLTEPDERDCDFEQQERKIKTILASANSMIFSSGKHSGRQNRQA